MMKKVLLVLAVGAFLLASCDKVEQPYGPSVPQGSYELYPDGDSAHYAQNAWPTFPANTSDDRNVLLEDYTGHKCTFCPAAAAEAENIKAANSGRVIVMGIHAGPNGTENLQMEDATYFGVFYNYISEALGQHFGVNWPGSNFAGNPYGAISRKDNGNGTPMEGPQTWANSVADIITTNDNKVRLQAMSNYYTTTKGLFLHTEIEVVDQSLTNPLNIVAYLVEDSHVAPQLDGSTTVYDYVHHDILRESLDGSVWGQELDAEHLDNGKYYFNYIYEVPDAYDDTNSHLVIFVRDDVTEEVYQVIKHDF
ncbi:Omp28-related outer membrane protein [Crocinitomicaceae bacterium]|nr:Omp28-related outer membrane protein [Crocinitomicaceae bacterium]